MEWLISDLPSIIAAMPMVIIRLTNFLKTDKMSSKVKGVLPYGFALLFMIVLFFAFNEQSIWIYLINGFFIAFFAQDAYSTSKKSVLQERDWKDNDPLNEILTQ